MTSARQSIERVRATVEYLRVSIGTDDEGQWLDCEPLVTDPEALANLVASTAEGRGTDRDDVATSLFVQGYAFRIASIALGASLLDEVVLDVDPAITSIALGRHRPNAVRLDEARTAGEGIHALHANLVDGHLAGLVATAHESCRVGEALLWGNVGAGCASSFGALMGPLEDRRLEIRDRFEAFLAAGRPELQASGRVVHVGPLWAWERSACCLWYKTDSGFQCEDCSLWSDEERQERYRKVLAELDA